MSAGGLKLDKRDAAQLLADAQRQVAAACPAKALTLIVQAAISGV